MSDDRTRLWHRLILGVTGHFRRRRANLLIEVFPDVDGYVVCDLGGSKHFWWSVGGVLQPRRVDVVNVESSALDAAGVSEGLDSRFRFLVYDGRRLDCEADHYDLLLCNSVIEHVPPPDRPALAREMTRASPRVFVQTPAYAFPVDPHFLMPFVHWLPRPVARVLVRVSPWRLLSRSDRSTTDRYFDETRLLKRAEVESLFPAATVHTERWCGLPKSYVAVVGAHHDLDERVRSIS